MKSNAYNRLGKELIISPSKPLYEYSSSELVCYLLKKYPENPIEAIDRMAENLDIGSILYPEAKIILEGMGC